MRLALLVTLLLFSMSANAGERSNGESVAEGLQGVMSWLEDKALEKQVETELSKLEKPIAKALFDQNKTGVLIDVRIFKHSSGARALGSVLFIGAGKDPE